jgi:hypothetical protein
MPKIKENAMTTCARCNQLATRTADKWFQFPRDPQRLTALCETHWDELLTALERPWNWVAPSCPALRTQLVSPPLRNDLVAVAGECISPVAVGVEEGVGSAAAAA